MKRLFTLLAAALAVASFAMPTDASAQGRQRNNAPTQTQIDEDVRELLQDNRITCDYDTARFLGRNDEGRTLYEIGCHNVAGFLLLDSAPPQIINCIANNASVVARRAADPAADVGAECTLPSNIDILATIQPIAQSAGIDCTVDAGRWVGATTDGSQRYEIGCSNADGSWVDVNTAGEPSNVMSCLQVVGAGGQCTLSLPAEQAAWVASLAAPSGRSCQATSARYVGANTGAGTRYYEVGCSDGAGFMVRTDNDNAFQAVVECAAAGGIAGGCTLSEAGAVAASANANYQRRLSEAGFACNVVQAGTPRQETEGDQRTVVEFKCSDRPWGLVAFLPNGAGSAEQIDCLTGEARIGGCSLTPRSDMIAQLTSLMSTRPNARCTVDDFRFAGRLGEGQSEFSGDVVELKCAQGNGYVAVVTPDRSQIVQAQTCAVSAERGGTRCQL